MQRGDEVGDLTIVALGAELDHLTHRAAELLSSGEPVLLKTAQIGCAAWLTERGVPFETLDPVFASVEDFDGLNQALTAEILRRLQEGNLIYGVLDLRDESVRALEPVVCAREIVPGVPIEGALLLCAQDRYQSVAAADWADFAPDSQCATLVREIDSKTLASEIKLRLMERYPDEWSILVYNGDAMESIPLYKLDQLPSYGHRVSAFLPAVKDVKALSRFGFEDLNRIVRVLRGPNGCPWDIKQTHASLKSSVLEEAYETADAIDRDNLEDLYEELGDLLLQISLHAEIARQHGKFSMDDVTTAICQKMITRHPHIFGQATAESAEDVSALWQVVKKQEKQQSTQGEVLRAVTRSLPALVRAETVQKRAADVHFDWSSAMDAYQKILEEAREVGEAMEKGEGYADELGDLLFSVVNVARWMRVAPEEALSQATEKFIRRFEQMEQRILADGLDLSAMTSPEKDVYWERVKKDMQKSM